MKKISTLLLACLGAYISQAQLLLVHDFNYADNLSNHNWSIHSGGTDNPILTTTGLTYAGYAGSGIGNAARLNGAGQDVNKGFALQSANGTSILMSAMVNVPNADTAKAAYFMHLGKRNSPTSFSNFCARVYAQTDGEGHVSFGLSNNQDNTNGTYSPTVFLPNITYLIIVKYTINTAGADDVKLWIKTTGVPQTEAAAGTPDVEIASEDKLLNDEVDAVGLRQTGETPQVIVDGLRIGNDWQTSVLPVILNSFKVTPYNNTALVKWTCTAETNVQSYEVMKSKNGKDFAIVATVAAKNSTQADYSFADNNIGTGDSYYQLKITDKDGKVSYSSIQRLPGFAGKLQLYPNPVVADAVLLHPAAVNGAAITIFDAAGKKWKTISITEGATQTHLSLQQLAAGNYLVLFKNGSHESVYKFTKQ